MFLRRDVIENVGPWNESIGPGAGTPWGAGEGTEYLLRCLDAGFHLSYQPSVEVHHPAVSIPFESHLEKSRKYAMGQGRVLHLCGYPGWYAAYHWSRPLYGAAVGLLKKDPERTIVALAVTQGIIGGWSSGTRPAARSSIFNLRLQRRHAQGA